MFQGFFGKGSLSRGYPTYGISKKGIPPLIKERQWEKRKLWLEKMRRWLVQDDSNKNCLQTEKGSIHSSSELEVNNTTTPEITQMEVEVNGSDCNSKNLEIDVIDQLQNSLNKYSKTTDLDVNGKFLVIADSDDEDLEKVIRDPQPHLEHEPIKTVPEVLNLTLQEAFFLSYALGCLHVIDDMTGNAISINQMWISFCELNPTFIELYVAYHHFRAKGWIVKTGDKFGGDFCKYIR